MRTNALANQFYSVGAVVVVIQIIDKSRETEKCALCADLTVGSLQTSGIKGKMSDKYQWSIRYIDAAAFTI